MSDAAPSVMALLRESTREHHDQAEHHEFQRAFVAGELPRRAYVEYLEQMYLVHDELERRLLTAADSVPAIGHVVVEHQRQVPYLLEDLDFFDSEPAAIEALPQTAALLEAVRHLAVNRPVGLLGMHYVLEGSNNGSRFIARNVAKAYALEPGPGLRYLDPYGARQRPLWLDFKRDMDAQSFSSEETGVIVEAAKAMFDGIADISTGLQHRAAA